MTQDLTTLLKVAVDGRPAAMDQLFAEVYDQLKRLARRELAGGPNPTLNTTGLVHELYLKLTLPDTLLLRDRGHFFAVAARAMRQIVIDHARRRHAEKRGGLQTAATLDDSVAAESLDVLNLIHLDTALDRLQALEPKLAELVEMRYFAGLSVEQIAGLRDVTTRTIGRDWRKARAFLFDAVNPQPTAG
ncbi:sigma-70 family RNA polymerase sigma factor [Pseudolysobacter antarcticus]|uniref:Sigma-70 family RNA polymerase sigma factor n=1 Tax=Pseudolysobacter antarcticus TaxID=2511995 RepID=A0A411HN54_9GAMM|nr:ECF-type sigma factor [Pseudolysobacter antarcticus]QBB71925.1 sigma-70 family RNA polymerase sigma factor [Pseudolysobacter antarcticus]